MKPRAAISRSTVSTTLARPRAPSRSAACESQAPHASEDARNAGAQQRNGRGFSQWNTSPGRVRMSATQWNGGASNAAREDLRIGEVVKPGKRKA